MTRGARQNNLRPGSRLVAGAWCLALLLAEIVLDNQALEQPIRTPSTQNPKVLTRLPVLPQPQRTVTSIDFVSRAASGLDRYSFTLDNSVRCSETTRIVAEPKNRTSDPTR